MKLPILLCVTIIIFQFCLAAAAASTKERPHGNACEIGTDASTTIVHPRINDTYEIGADGHRIALVNYDNATNPTYAELLAFIKADKTDEKTYEFDSFLCSDFAETVHNNAEKLGINVPG